MSYLRKITKSFTLIDMLISLSVMLIVTGIFLTTVRGVRLGAQKKGTKAMIAALEVAITRYHADVAKYPEDDPATPPGFYSPVAVLYDRLTNKEAHKPTGTYPIPGWNGPYMSFDSKDIKTSTGEIIDPWSTAYNYNSNIPLGSPPTNNPTSFDLWSSGPNKSSGDGDDITNW